MSDPQRTTETERLRRWQARLAFWGPIVAALFASIGGLAVFGFSIYHLSHQSGDAGVMHLGIWGLLAVLGLVIAFDKRVLRGLREASGVIRAVRGKDDPPGVT